MDFARVLAREPEITASAGVPPRSDARREVELQLGTIGVRFGQLDYQLEVLEARLTGEFPVISTAARYDVAGIEAEPGFHLTYAMAVEGGRRMEELVSELFVEDDIAY